MLLEIRQDKGTLLFDLMELDGVEYRPNGHKESMPRKMRVVECEHSKKAESWPVKWTR